MSHQAAAVHNNRSRPLQVTALLLGLLAGDEASARAARVSYGRIPDEIWSYMQGRSWHPELPCPQRNELVLLRIPYLDFQGNTQIGSMVVAEALRLKSPPPFRKYTTA